MEDAPEADDEGIDRGGGEVKLGAQTSKSVMEVTIRTRTGMHTLPSEKKLEILEYTFNQARRLQSANKAWWRDVKIHRSKDVPWRKKRRRMLEHVYCVFCFWERKLVLE